MTIFSLDNQEDSDTLTRKKLKKTEILRIILNESE